MTTPSELIDEMIEQTPDWRGAALAEFRRIIHEADPDIVEEVKWRRPSNPMGAPVFEHAGIVCTANILKERVRLSFPAGIGLPDPHKILTAVTEGNKTRIIDLHEGDTVDEDALRELIRAAVERNLSKSKGPRKHRVFAMEFAKVYPLYVQKAERKNRTKDEVDQIISWLTGYDQEGLQRQIELGNDFETFFAQAPAFHPNSSLIKGVVCGVRVEEIEDPLMQKMRYLDKLIDELARGKAMEKILRQSTTPPA